MAYALQYQAFVDDLTSLVAASTDVSWFTLQPYEAPQAPTLLPEGLFVGDVHSAAGQPEDVSWFTTFAHESPVERQVPESGFFATDLHSAGGEPTDVSWFTTLPHQPATERELGPQGFFAADLTSGAAVVTDDQSWFATFPDTAPVESEVVPQGHFAGDVDSAGGEPADVSWFTTFANEAPVEREVAPQGFVTGDFTTADAVVWTSAGTPYRLWLHTSANWRSSADFYAESMMKAATGTARMRIYNETDGAEVAGSEATTASATYVRVRAAAVNLADAKEYRLQFGTVAGDSGQAYGGTILNF